MNKLHLIVVDGNELTRALLKYVFQASSAIEVVGDAADYKSAIALLGMAIPDAVIVGNDLAEMEKATLVSAIQSDYPGVRVIELSELENAFLRRANLFPKDQLDQKVFTAIIARSPSGSTH